MKTAARLKNSVRSLASQRHILLYGSKRRHNALFAVSTLSVAAAVVVVTTSTTVLCEEKIVAVHDLPPNPLWPGGVPDSMVKEFVDEILEDTDVNIPGTSTTTYKKLHKPPQLLRNL